MEAKPAARGRRRGQKKPASASAALDEAGEAAGGPHHPAPADTGTAALEGSLEALEAPKPSMSQRLAQSIKQLSQLGAGHATEVGLAGRHPGEQGQN